MTATIVEGYIRVHSCEKANGITFVTVSCVGDNYCDWADWYKAAPDVIELDGVRLGKTGWNSDYGVVYYRSDAQIAQIIK